ncbi:unnamed protein product [Polarella glacialis]|uniref:FAD-dependent oxidoreductase 2 FAD-binding domain-containing protein n=1 Tax=Polarella glacialis TaxID=89957 RepID=A0A813EGE3_POLGL|nr:unnamed protein product [Polarella glacialis]
MAAVFPASHVIVVGGGLAGMVAANQVLECGGRVVILEKSAFCGGNSSKGTAGISGSSTPAQKSARVQDSPDSFIEDTIRAGVTNSEYASVLCMNSGPDLNWLMDKFDLDLSLLSKSDGHSQPRTHRGKERFPGMTITYALTQMVEKIAEVSDRARIITKAEVGRLLVRQGSVIGCEYRKAGKVSKEYGPVILATGGFGADFSSTSLLSRLRPDLLHLPTISVEQNTGDAVKMSEAVGAKTVDLEWVQVHPTGLVDPEQPDAKVKILAAEVLRSAGGILLNAQGERFCNEMGPLDHILSEMWKTPAPLWLCLNAAASREALWHCKLYARRGLMRHYATGRDLAKDMGVPLQRLVDVHEAHAQAAQESTKLRGEASEPPPGPWPGYPSGRSWDEPSGRTGYGKLDFSNALPGSAFVDEPFYVAMVTPVIHYCAGGLQISPRAEVLREDAAVPGLYAAGEVAGGVHGRRCLGGNALLDCVVFGRVAAKSACQYAFGEDDEFRPCPLPASATFLSSR